MSAPHEDFTNLRRLLAFKRHEQPPPGYFDHLRQRVTSQLEADELVEYSSWWRWLMEKFDARPVLVCMYGAVVSGLLLAGFRLSQVFEDEVAANPIFTVPWLAVTPGSSPALPEEFDQNNPPETYFPMFTGFSKNARSVFGAEASPLLFNDASRLRLDPISSAVSAH